LPQNPEGALSRRRGGALSRRRGNLLRLFARPLGQRLAGQRMFCFALSNAATNSIMGTL
jgi:hypothetical protein